MIRRDISDRTDLPRWLREAELIEPCWNERIEAADLRYQHQLGATWRETHESIVGRITARTPAAYCREIWSEHITASQLCWARGALGLSWDDPVSVPVPALESQPVATRPKGCLF